MVARRSLTSPAGAIPTTLLLISAALSAVSAEGYKIDTRDDILATSRTLAFDLMSFYSGNKTGEVPGLLPGPPAEGLGDYYWWQGGAFWGAFIDYWRLTGDDTYNNVVIQGLLHQVGDDDDFMPPNQTASMGNDDQCMWGMSAMLAAESRFPNPSGDQPSWLSLAENVFRDMAARIDTEEKEDSSCGGGLRWTIFPFSAGYNYKNAQSNGCFLNLASRLARFTGNQTYADHAEKTWDWLSTVGLIDNSTWRVYDGAHVENNCTDVNKATFSISSTMISQGAAFMYNFTDGSETWRNRTANLVDRFETDFFEKGALFELPCERKTGVCTVDMLFFKGLSHRSLASSAQVAPFLAGGTLLPTLRNSAQAAVDQCTGGDSGRQCGFYWTTGQFSDPSLDKTSGVGEQMDVLGAVSSLLIGEAAAPATQSEDGSDGRGDPGDGKTDNSGGSGNDTESGGGEAGSDGGSAASSLRSASLLTIAGTVMWGVVLL